jgi:predicted ATPase
MQGQSEEGIAHMRQGIANHQALSAEIGRTWFLAMLAEAYKTGGQSEEGLRVLTEALDAVNKRGEGAYEAELYRLKGELLLAQEGLRPQAKGLRGKTEEEKGSRPQAKGVREKTEEAEGCFLRAIEIAQKQQAKSLELRAVMSLVRLRQQQAVQSESRNTDHASRTKLDEAHRMLPDIYGWFTEGFDTKDLQEAKALLQKLKGA